MRQLTSNSIHPAICAERVASAVYWADNSLIYVVAISYLIKYYKLVAIAVSSTFVSIVMIVITALEVYQACRRNTGLYIINIES